MSELPPTYLPGWHQDDFVKKMKYSQLGSTDLIVSKVGFGGCVVGGVYPDKGDLEEIYQVRLMMIVKSYNLILCCSVWRLD